jgi:plastocyanin
MRRITIALLAAAALVAGCGGDDQESAATPTPTAEETQEPAAGGGETVAVSSPADGALKFDQATLTAPAGEVTFDYDNPSTVPHALEIEGNGVEAKTDTITEGKASVTVELKAGEYKFYCPVGSHAAAGMEGMLTVE